MPLLSQADKTIQARSWATIPLALAVLLASLGTSSANVALPTLALAFGVPFGKVQWVVLAYLLAMTALLVAAGRFGDLIGRRRLFLAGLVLSAVASVACAVAPDLAALVAARSVQGAGAAVLMAMSFALVGEAVPGQRRGAAMGVLAAMSSLGTTLGPALGGFVLAGPGWRVLFLLNVPLAVAAGLIGWRHLPRPPSLPGPRQTGFDWPGMVLLAASLTAYAVALTPGQAGALGGGVSLGLLAAAAVGVALFLLRQARTPSPLLALDLFRDGVLDVGLATSALVSTVMMATLVTGPFYLSRALGLRADRGWAGARYRAVRGGAGRGSSRAARGPLWGASRRGCWACPAHGRNGVVVAGHPRPGGVGLRAAHHRAQRGICPVPSAQHGGRDGAGGCKPARRRVWFAQPRPQPGAAHGRLAHGRAVRCRGRCDRAGRHFARGESRPGCGSVSRLQLRSGRRRLPPRLFHGCDTMHLLHRTSATTPWPCGGPGTARPDSSCVERT